MYAKKWIILLFIGSVSFIIFVVSFNIYIDYYSIFNNENLNKYQGVNQNFIKIKNLLNKNIKANSFIFGSSRVGVINPQLFENGKYYNMTYLGGLPKEHLDNIKLLVNQNYKIKNIVIGLDDFSYEIDYLTQLNDIYRIPHYLTSDKKFAKIKFYSIYVLKVPSIVEIKKILQSFLNIKILEFTNISLKNGMLKFPTFLDENIEKNITLHVNNKNFLRPTHFRGNRIDKTINEIKQMIVLAKKNNINIKFFINPIHITTYLDTNFENFLEFKKKLANLTDFIDFSGINKITTNNYYYYETSHYRIMVGDMIAKRLQNSKNDESDFGVYVNKNNINEHIQNLKNELKNYKNTHKLDF